MRRGAGRVTTSKSLRDERRRPLVRFLKPQQAGTNKERVSVWSPAVYTIKDIRTSLGQKHFYIEGQSEPYLRHELLYERVRPGF